MIEERLAVLAKQAIEEKVFPGCVIAYIKDDSQTVLPFGNFTYDQSSPQVQEDSIYDLASITKSIPTASLALMLIDEKKLDPKDKLINYVPEFRNSDRDRVLIRHLLTYALDGYGLASIKNMSGKEILEHIMTRDFERRPGTVFKYTNVPAGLLGIAVERIMGDTLDKLAGKYFFEPLSMTRTTFFPEKFSKEEIVPTEIDDWRGLVQGSVHDESASIFKSEGRIVGYAGLFSTAPDIIKFMSMLLAGGESEGKRFFSKKMIDRMGDNQIANLNDFCGLGWELNQPRFMGPHCTPHTFGKTGFTGTLCVCDVSKQVAYVILTNRIFPKRPKDSAAIHQFRAKVGEILLA